MVHQPGIYLNSLTVDLAPASAADPSNSVMIICPYNCQLSSQQNVYLRTDTNNTNIQTESFNAENTDVVGATQLSSSRILAKMIIKKIFQMDDLVTGEELLSLGVVITQIMTIIKNLETVEGGQQGV